jgi:lipopolysaccharide transport system permease protein
MVLTKFLDIRANFAALAEIFIFGRRYRMLIFEMTRRELIDRHAASVLGAFWAFGTPLLQLSLYVYVFTFIFHGRLTVDDTGLAYTAFVLAGLVPWMNFQDAISRASIAVVSNANLVKQIVFPSEVLPLKVTLAAVAPLLVGLIITSLLSAVNGNLSLVGVLVLLPSAVCLFCLFVAGLAYALAAVAVFIRDISEGVSFLLSVGLFLHPILYTPSQTPHWLASLFVFSPLTHLIWCFRDALVEGQVTRPLSWIVAALTSLAFCAIGWRIFRGLKPTFGNVL